MDDSELLQEFTRTRSQAAFSALVNRHVNLVYAAARRQVRDPGLAEDVTQGVFIVLARKAHKVRNAAALPGWLLGTTRYVASTANRARARRTQRETEAAVMRASAQSPEPAQDWQQMEPEIDAALASLPSADRDALALRYFQGKSLAEVGAAIGVSEDAARKRIDRALAKLRAFLTRRGVNMSVASVAGGIALAAHAEAAPAALAASISSTALTTAAATGAGVTLAEAAMNVMFWAKLKLAALIVAACVVPVTVAAVALPRAASKPAATSTAYVLHGRLVDGKGAPVPGAQVEIWADKGGREERPKTTSDANGSFTLSNSLNSKILLVVTKPGFREITSREIETSDTLQTITYLRLLNVTGNVTDSATHQPVADFQVMPGGAWNAGQRFVERDKPLSAKAGRYSITFKWPYPEVWVHIEAPGYLPADSQIFRTEEGDVTANIELKPASNIVAKVLLPNGSPAAGATIYVSDGRSSIHLDDRLPTQVKGPTSQRSTTSSLTADDGRLTLTPQTGPFQIVAVHEAGIGFSVSDGTRPPTDIRLSPWGKLQGAVAKSLRTTQPQKVTVQLDYAYDVMYRQERAVNRDGSFSFEHVPPGELLVSIMENFERSRIGIGVPDHLQLLEIQPGQAAQATVGGSGAIVTGRAILPPTINGDLASRFVYGQITAPLAPRFTTRPTTRPTTAQYLAARAAEAKSFAVRINNDGTFLVKDVPPGKYLLHVEVQELNEGPSWGPGKAVARLTKPIEVTQTADHCDVGLFVLEPPPPPPQPSTKPSPAIRP